MTQTVPVQGLFVGDLIPVARPSDGRRIGTVRVTAVRVGRSITAYSTEPVGDYRGDIETRRYINGTPVEIERN